MSKEQEEKTKDAVPLSLLVLADVNWMQAKKTRSIVARARNQPTESGAFLMLVLLLLFCHCKVLKNRVNLQQKIVLKQAKYKI